MHIKASHVGYRLKTFRKHLGLTQRGFAVRLGTTQGNVSQIEHGSCMPAGNYIASLIRIFPTVNLNWLFYGEGSMLRETVGKAADYENRMRGLEDEIRALKQDNRSLIAILAKRS